MLKRSSNLACWRKQFGRKEPDGVVRSSLQQRETAFQLDYIREIGCIPSQIAQEYTGAGKPGLPGDEQAKEEGFCFDVGWLDPQERLKLILRLYRPVRLQIPADQQPPSV